MTTADVLERQGGNSRDARARNGRAVCFWLRPSARVFGETSSPAEEWLREPRSLREAGLPFGAHPRAPGGTLEVWTAGRAWRALI